MEQSKWDLEYALDNGLEVERPIQPGELPENLRIKYKALTNTFDQILLEKVFQLNNVPSHEFYCYKDSKLTQYDFEQ